MSTTAGTAKPIRKKRGLAIGLPLLTRELIEQSARRRTYWLRALYACLFYVAAGFFWYDSYSYRIQGGPLNVLGTGRNLFEVVLGLQFAGIYMFLPAMTCGVLTSEKERNTMSLLLLTRLGPWKIVVEKLLSRLVPMLFFLLLSVPLIVFSYSLGGLSQGMLWGGLWVLALTAFQVAALALFCSAYCRTTAAAFISTYVVGFVLIFFMVITEDGLDLIPWSDMFEFCIDAIVGPGTMQSLQSTGVIRHKEELTGMFFGPILALDFNMWLTSSSIWTWIIRTTPLFLSGWLFLVLARVFVVRRAFVPPQNRVLSLFRAFDRAMKDLNDRYGRGIVVVKGAQALPAFAPVAWRETSKTTLGSFRYLLRLLIVVEAPIVLFTSLIIAVDADTEPITFMVSVFWILAALLVTVKSASIIPSERSRETLDVLLTTPMSARDIVRQKLRGVWRLALVLFFAYATLIAAQILLKSIFATDDFYGSRMRLREYPYSFGYSVWFERLTLYGVCSLLAFVVYIPLIAYLSLFVGLCLRTQTRAIMGSIVLIAAWCTAPLLLPLFLFEFFFPPGYWEPDSPVYFLFLFSPATVIALNEYDDLHEIARMPWPAMIINFTFYTAVALLLRRICLHGAARLLKRNEDSHRPLPALFRAGDQPGDEIPALNNV